ncbi:MAG: ABC transporter ATP-binding protein [Myxococcales bacterium]|nr:ABC transporter ATP-binding protein [Myxococcales bacterium]
MTPGGASVLSLDKVEKIFGGLRAIAGVSFAVEKAQIFGLIGPNGAGKTTIFNVVTGVYQPDGGRVTFDGEDISGWPPAKVAARGIARTFQNIRIFRSMTVEQNVMVAGFRIHKAGLLSAVLRGRRYMDDEREFRRRAAELLQIFKLEDLASEPADSLPYGSQRRLEIARALMLSPKLLLLDEPAAGMNSQEALELEKQIRFLRDELGLTVVLVEHNMSVVMAVCEQIHVVDHGETIAEGPPAEIKEHPKVLAAYLGEESPEQAVRDLEAVSSPHHAKPEEPADA